MCVCPLCVMYVETGETHSLSSEFVNPRLYPGIPCRTYSIHCPISQEFPCRTYRIHCPISQEFPLYSIDTAIYWLISVCIVCLLKSLIQWFWNKMIFIYLTLFICSFFYTDHVMYLFIYTFYCVFPLISVII